MKYANVIIEGVDRLGKDTVITTLQQILGRQLQTIHYQKPLLLPVNLMTASRVLNLPELDPEVKSLAYYWYQRSSFEQMFKLLGSVSGLALNRAHLGETVYAPRYRGYDGEYVFELENENAEACERTLLVVLWTDDWSFIADDGESFDFSKKEEEQADFLRFALMSRMKVAKVQVNDGGKFRSREAIGAEIAQYMLGHEDIIYTV